MESMQREERKANGCLEYKFGSKRDEVEVEVRGVGSVVYVQVRYRRELHHKRHSGDPTPEPEKCPLPYGPHHQLNESMVPAIREECQQQTSF